MSLEQKKQKLETVIEQKTHKLVNHIAEHVYDFVHLYTRRQQMLQSPEEQAAMEQVLGVVKLAISDGFMTKVDLYQKDISASLEDFLTQPAK
jgi:CO dehydrogenase/acetyl-CoA synthase beta subunit